MAKAKEPTFDRPLTQIVLTSTLNWYNNNRTSNDARKYLHEYCKREINSKLTISDISKWSYLATDGWVSRLLTNGVEFPFDNAKVQHNARIKRYIRVAREETVELKPKEKVENTVAPTVMPRGDSILAQLEHEVDQFVFNNCKPKFDFAKWLVAKDVKQKDANDIKRWAKMFIRHLDEVITLKPDKQLKEGYSNFSKPQLKRLHKWYQTMYDESEVFIKSNRKPRKKVNGNGGSETQASLEGHLTTL